MKEWIITPDRFLSKAEMGKLLQKAEDLRTVGIAKAQKQPVRDWLILRLALLSGLRANELTSLKVSDCYIGYARSEIVVLNGKGGKSRQVKIGDDLKRDLRWFMRWKEEQGELEENAYLLRSQRAERMTTSAIWRRWKTHCPNHRLHDSRHTYATLLYQSSKDIRLVQKQLGHSRTTTTAIYADVCDEQARASIKLMEQATRLALQREKHCEFGKNLPFSPSKIAGSIAT